jgi:pyruvate dehydrogenase E1 component beta subunit
MFGGQVTVPLVVRMPQGSGQQLGPTHAHSLEALLLQIPGLLIAVPTTAADAKGLLKTAIRDDNPVVVIEHESLYSSKGEVPEDEHLVPFGQAVIRRPGKDVTLLGISRGARTALEAADVLEREHGVSAEVIDPRTLRPLDLETIVESVERTNRLVIVEEGWPQGGVGATIAALVSEHAFDHLDAPVLRVTGADAPVGYSRVLERAAVPDARAVAAAALQSLARG